MVLNESVDLYISHNFMSQDVNVRKVVALLLVMRNNKHVLHEGVYEALTTASFLCDVGKNFAYNTDIYGEIQTVIAEDATGEIWMASEYGDTQFGQTNIGDCIENLYCSLHYLALYSKPYTQVPDIYCIIEGDYYLKDYSNELGRCITVIRNSSMPVKEEIKRIESMYDTAFRLSCPKDPNVMYDSFTEKIFNYTKEEIAEMRNICPRCYADLPDRQLYIIMRNIEKRK